MIKIEAMPTDQKDDAELVAATLAGNKDAFRQIVERHQTLICSLAYCATGSVSKSEDLAQEIFVTAWRDLAELREPAKLKSWLCAITRFRISKQFRRQDRDPIHAAEQLEAIESSATPEATPLAQAISNEETAILWRSLEQIPEIYREPLVLFYREHQSIETVAANLDLTEDVVKQRLSRGRKMLQEQVLSFVEGALVRTNPGQFFTLGVLAALPAMTISAKAATLGAAAKGGAVVKGSGLLGFFAAFLAPAFAFFNIWFDYRLHRKAGHSERELKLLRGHYFGIVLSVIMFVAICSVLMNYGGLIMKTSLALFGAAMAGLILTYFVLIALFVWRYICVARKMAAEQPPAETSRQARRPLWEYRSRFELLGLPLIHIRFGIRVGGRMDERLKNMKPVKAWIAITDGFSIGVLFAYGGCAIAPVSMGAAAVGLFSFGAMSIGMIAVGGFGFGIWSLAIFAVGWQGYGECVIAWHAALGGKYAVAHDYAVAHVAYALQINNDLVWQTLKANPFFQFCRANLTPSRMILLSWVWLIPMMVSQLVQIWIALRQPSSK